jgi:hypothetical protein
VLGCDRKLAKLVYCVRVTHNTARLIVFTWIVSGRCWSSMRSRVHNKLCVSSHTAHQRVYNMHTSNNDKTAYLHSLLTNTLQNWFQLREIIIFEHDTNCTLTEYYLNGEPNKKNCFWTEIFLNGSVNKNQTWLLRMHSSLHLVKYMIWLLNPGHSKASKFKV